MTLIKFFAILELFWMVLFFIVLYKNYQLKQKSKPTYNSLVKRMKELIVLCRAEPNNKAWEDELIQVNNSLKSIDRIIIKRSNPNSGKGNYTSSLDIITAFKATQNNLQRPVGSQRPDLTFIVTGKTKNFDEFSKWYNSLTAEQVERFQRADAWIPELIQIAEMYVDVMQNERDSGRIKYAYALTILNRIYYGNKTS